MLELDIEKKLGDTLISCSFKTVSSGVTALFGHSGAGKTSVINMIAGLTKADKGRISFNGRVFFDSVKKIDLPSGKRSIGYVFQDARLFPNMNVLKNLLYGSGRKSQKPLICRPEELYKLLGIYPLLERMPKSLSGGEKQRVSIGRALLSNPEILLMDEPLASLDGERRSELLEYIGAITEKFDIPIIYVSHSVEEIVRLADNIALMENGKLVRFGKAVDILNEGGIISEAGELYEGEVTEYYQEDKRAVISFGGGNVVDVFSEELKPFSKVRFRINAVDVVLCVSEPPPTSARNKFSGTVKSLRPAMGNFCDVEIDIGVPLISRISEKSVEELGIKTGKKVYALVKNALISNTMNIFRKN